MSNSKPFTAPVNGDDLVKEGSHSPPQAIPQNQSLVQQESQASITSRISQMVIGSLDEATQKKDEDAPSASNFFAGNRYQKNSSDIKKENKEENHPTAISITLEKEENRHEKEYSLSQALKGSQTEQTELAHPLLAPSGATLLSDQKEAATEPKIASATSLQQSFISTETMEYKSHEKREQLHKDNLNQTGKKFHTSSFKIPVKVGKKEEVIVEVFVCPAVTDNNTLKAALDIRISISRNLLKRLHNNQTECGIMVKTEVWDNSTRQNIGCTQFHTHAVNMNDGKVTFRQDLVSCEAVNGCKSSSVTLVFKAIFVTTAPKQEYTTTEHEEFEVIEVGDKEL